MKITGATGTVTDTYDFDEFGTQIMSQGNTPNAYRYTGQQSDADSGLLYLRARYYEPSTGRFLTKDPNKGNIKEPVTMNPYIYCRNNPLKFTDPSGLDVYRDIDIGEASSQTIYVTLELVLKGCAWDKDVTVGMAQKWVNDISAQWNKNDLGLNIIIAWRIRDGSSIVYESEAAQKLSGYSFINPSLGACRGNSHFSHNVA